MPLTVKRPSTTQIDTQIDTPIVILDTTPPAEQSQSEVTKSNTSTAPKLPPYEVAKIIKRLVLEYNMHPIDINSGDCHNFAVSLCDILGPEAHALWGNEDLRVCYTPAHDPERHAYTEYLGRYYDAEEPYGVDSPDQLPFFMRQVIQYEPCRERVYGCVRSMYR